MARAGIVHQASEEFFARPALASDQNGGRTPRERFGASRPFMHFPRTVQDRRLVLASWRGKRYGRRRDLVIVLIVQRQFPFMTLDKASFSSSMGLR